MKALHIRMAKTTLMVAALFLSCVINAQEADNTLSIGIKSVARGELRYGGYSIDSLNSERRANFVLGQVQIDLNYKRSWLELQISPKQTFVWGHGTGSIALAEAWAQLKSKKGFFAKVGRQMLAYDDERILGYDDWTMTAPTHDVLKLGYEGHNHKVHFIFAYNQNADNPDSGNTYYANGLQPHKLMQTMWYHYDTPKSLYGLSLLFMNIGMQSVDQERPLVYYQQLLGTYMTLKPKHWQLEGAFYYQMGKQESGIPIDAFLGSGKAKFMPNEIYSLYAGYDYLSGDKYFATPSGNHIGMVFHDKIRGFNAIYGSHHDFYGSMVFFYLNNYVGNFTPGLQNLYIGGTVNPVKPLSVNVAYHYYAIATNLDYVNTKSLGHAIDLTAAYSFSDLVKLSAGYSFMQGTETMAVLQHLSESRKMHWAWLMLTVTPKKYSVSWQDKK